MGLIQCPECAKEISDSNKKCPHCGYRIKKANVKKIVAIVGGVVITGVCVTAVVLYFNSPITKFNKSLKDKNYDNAGKIYNESIKSSDKYKRKIEDKLKANIEIEISDYAKGTITLDDCSGYVTFCKDIIDNDWDSINQKIEVLSSSKQDFNDGEESFSNAEYITAIEDYEKVVEEDIQNYEKSISQVELCKKEYCNQIVEQLTEHMNSDSVINSYDEDKKQVSKYEWLSEDQEVQSALKTYSERVKEAVMKSAQKSVDKKEYEKASSILTSNIPEEYADDSDVIELIDTTNRKIVKKTLSKVDKLVKSSEYEKADDLLAEKAKYDVDSKLSNKRKDVQELLKQQVISEFKQLKEKVSIVYDDVSDSYTIVKKGYSSKYINISSGINIEARGTVTKSGITSFDLLVGFEQKDWIFTEIVQFSSSDYKKTVYVPYLSRYTQVIWGSIAEWMYITNLEDVTTVNEIIENITKDDKVTIRFSADGNGSRDHVITDAEKDNIRTMKKFFDMLDKYSYLKEYVK